MTKLNQVLVSGVVSIVMVASVAVPVLAWHPKGVIIKSVQNQTTGSVLSDANTDATAVAAKPGDVLKYVITVSNNGSATSNGHNDMHKTVMTDTLPAGVELVADPAKRTITENLGVLKPGQKATKEYLVKVTAQTDGSITNTACFTGDSKVNDAPQKGCDPAKVTVTVPEPPKEPPVTPEEPKTPEKPAPKPPVQIPSTGPESIIASAASLGAVGYGASAYIRSRRNLHKV